MTVSATVLNFKTVGLEWYELRRPNWSESCAVRQRRNLEKDMFPLVGVLAMSEIHAMQVLAAV